MGSAGQNSNTTLSSQGLRFWVKKYKWWFLWQTTPLADCFSLLYKIMPGFFQLVLTTTAPLERWQNKTPTKKSDQHWQKLVSLGTVAALETISQRRKDPSLPSLSLQIPWITSSLKLKLLFLITSSQHQDKSHRWQQTAVLLALIPIYVVPRAMDE